MASKTPPARSAHSEFRERRCPPGGDRASDRQGAVQGRRQAGQADLQGGGDAGEPPAARAGLLPAGAAARAAGDAVVGHRGGAAPDRFRGDGRRFAGGAGPAARRAGFREGGAWRSRNGWVRPDLKEQISQTVADQLVLHPERAGCGLDRAGAGGPAWSARRWRSSRPETRPGPWGCCATWREARR